MCFLIFYNENITFYGTKRERLKCRKMDIFPKGLVHGFGPKVAIFPTFCFRQYRPGKCVFLYSITKK